MTPPRNDVAPTVLVVEDEVPVRRLFRRTLVEAGYEVLEAGSAAEAIDLWGREKERIDALLTDVVMPGGMSGRQLATQLTLERPQLKVLYVSGSAPEPTLPGAVYLAKPFSREGVVKTLDALLERGRSEGDRELPA